MQPLFDCGKISEQDPRRLSKRRIGRDKIKAGASPLFGLFIAPVFTENPFHNLITDIIRPLKIFELIGESISVVIGDAIRDILHTALKSFAKRLGVVRVVVVQIVYIVVVLDQELCL